MDTETPVTLNYLGNTVAMSLPKSFDQLVSEFNISFDHSFHPSLIISCKHAKKEEIKLSAEGDYLFFISSLHQNAISEGIDLNFDEKAKEEEEKESQDTPLTNIESIAQQFYHMKIKDKALNILKRKMILQKHLVSIIRTAHSLIQSFDVIRNYAVSLKEEDCSFDNDTKTNSFESLLYFESLNHSFELKNDKWSSMTDVSFIQLKDTQSSIDEDYDYLFLQEMIILLEEKKRMNCINNFSISSPTKEPQTPKIGTRTKVKEGKAERALNIFQKQKLISLSMLLPTAQAPLSLSFELINEETDECNGEQREAIGSIQFLEHCLE